jgi:hypothetical protein
MRAVQNKRLEENYQKACKRAEKKGRKLPPKDQYYNHWGYSYASKFTFLGCFVRSILTFVSVRTVDGSSDVCAACLCIWGCTGMCRWELWRKCSWWSVWRSWRG